ncbi:MAG: type II secretion system protein GspG [Planctomycetota bacterium]|nr:type II secretion system protein GspG [Planctomycetota bacterium]
MNANTQSKRSVPATSSESGFTLVEIMVVIVILGLLATLVARNVMGASDEARETTAKTNCTMIADSVRSYYSKNGTLPETLEELAEKDEKGRSELESLPLDPWGTPYELIPGDSPRDFEVISCGPDKQPETDDDISNKSEREDS